MEKKEEPEKGEKRQKPYTAQEKCQAVLQVWTERSKPGTICREMGVTWRVLNQWQEQAMEGMLMGLQPVGLEKGVALSPQLAVLLERKSKEGLMKGLDQRLARLQSKSQLEENELEPPETEGEKTL